MIKADQYYKQNLRTLLERGYTDENPRPKYKDGTPANSKFITQIVETYDISTGEFPITTLRNTATKMGIKEVLWIYQKQSNKLSDAQELGINWWNPWDIGDGTIGQRYGATVRRYDIMNKLLHGLEHHPFSRRHIMDLYQYQDFNESDGLHPCAFQTLWSVRKVNSEYYLDLTLVQRSNDYVVSGYINKIQYVALQMMIAGSLDYKCGSFMHIVQNLHIYDRHFSVANKILLRSSLEQQPVLELKENKNFYDYTVDDFEVKNIEGIEKLPSKLEIAIVVTWFQIIISNTLII